MTRVKTSSVTMIDCTTETCPLYSARACSTKLPTMAPTPNSHRGLRIRYSASRQPLSRAGAAVLATCWVMTSSELAKAAANANRTLTTLEVYAPLHLKR